MASSQVEIASSAYDHVLRDHNRRGREREIDINSRTRATFKKSFKGLVRDHFQTFNALSFPRDSYAGSDENCQNLDCWAGEDGRRNGDNFRRVDAQAESPALSRRNSRILDRWAARQAREMITTLERQTNEAELTQLSNSQTVSTRASSFQREASRAPAHSSVDLPNLLRASSLVQMWKEFEAEGRSPTGNQSGSASIRLNSTTSNGSVYSECCDSADDKYGVPEDSSTDCESDLTVTSENFSPSNGGISDISERVRVADIIRRYTSGRGAKSSIVSSSDENEQNQSVMLETSSLDNSMPNHGGQRDPPFTGITLRIRGRQAFLDLMKQMGRERQREIASLRERHAVSRFTHRGRIQSLLKVRFLRQRGAVQDQSRPISMASELNRYPQQTAIFHLRERFDKSVGQHGLAVLRRESNSSHVDIQKQNPSSSAQNSNLGSNHQVGIPLVKQSGTSMELHLMPSSSPHEHLQEETHEISHITQDGTSSSGSSPSEHLQEEACRISNVTRQRTRSESSSPCEHLQEQANGISDVKWQRTNSGSRSPSEHLLENVHGISDATWQGTSSRSSSPCEHWQEEANGYEDSTWQRTTSGARDPDFPDPVDTAVPMHVDISVDLHAREDEMSETDLGTSQHAVVSFDRWNGLEVEEELNLVEPTDMSWLSNDSGLRRNWEGQRQPWTSEMQEHDTDNEEIRDLLGRRRVSSLLASGFRAQMERLVLSYLQRQGNLAVVSTGEGDSSHEEYFQMASSSLQLPQPSQLTPWNHYDDQEINENSDAFPSTTSLPSPQSQSPCHNRQLFSSLANHSSLEIDLIYDLRGHLASLHQEMAELRKSMKSCMEMQMKLPNSIKQEVAAAVSHSIHGEAKESFKKVQSKKGNCCICYETKIDSLLYRCGHMCTCFNCANELQWSSSKCPICRAPILDVVRAYSDT